MEKRAQKEIKIYFYFASFSLLFGIFFLFLINHISFSITFVNKSVLERVYKGCAYYAVHSYLLRTMLTIICEGFSLVGRPLTKTNNNIILISNGTMHRTDIDIFNIRMNLHENWN
jgi:hypothetical protein